MSSSSTSSSSGFSDEDAGASALSAAAPSASKLSEVIELAQICSFCATFRKPLHLPSFSRTELQEALLDASSDDTTHMELLAELHFKLAREHYTAKMEKMLQDWEKTLARKLQDNWRKEFTANPMRGGVTYRDLTVFERVNILNALCHWKLDTCTEIHNHIAMLQKENNDEAFASLRTGEIGTDDKGVSYWYFGDECWVYAEDKPRWQLEERKPSYLVEFASAKRVRLSINFDPDHNSSAPPLRLPLKLTALSDGIKQEKKEKVSAGEAKEEKQKTKDDVHSSEAVKLENEHLAVTLVKTEEKKASSPSVVAAAGLFTERTTAVVEDVTTGIPTFKKLNIHVLNESSEQEFGEQRDVVSTGLLPLNMFAHERDGEGSNAAGGAASVNFAQITIAKNPASGINSPQSVATSRDYSKILIDNNDKLDKAGSEKTDFSERPEKRISVKVGEDNIENPTQQCVVAVMRANKRTIIDDDSSDSSSSDADTSKTAADKIMYHPAVSSPPLRKKRKASTESTCREAVLNVEPAKGDFTTLSSTRDNGTTTVNASKSDFVTPHIKEAIPSLVNADSVAFDLKEARSPQFDVVKLAVLHMEEPSLSSRRDEDNDVVIKSKSSDVKVSGNVINSANPSGATSMSPTDPAAAPETFDITCESCKKCYDMRYLDPPLVERPSDEWRCFECLVNDARGWPRRRKPTTRKIFSPRRDNRMAEPLFRKRSSLSKPPSGSSALKKSKIFSKSRSSSTLKTRNNDSSSYKRSSKRNSSKKSSSSSSKKHKKRKSSSSSRHRHGSGHSHHRRRHSHHYHEEFAKLVKSFRERQEQRFGIEDARMHGKLQVNVDEGPQGWRVASSTLDGLRALIQTLLSGSLEQDRLRGRLILIVKDQEKLEEQRRKQQELAWNILPRRQSSRIAIGRMRNQSAQDSDVEERHSGDDVENRRPGLRLKAASEVVDGKQKHDRAWRARRRRNTFDDDMQLDNEEDEVDNSDTGNWIDWSVFKDNGRCLSTVCLAVVNRLLKEEVSDLFSRPVNPEIDGCPNYLSVIDQPMDLGTIRTRAEANFYRKWKLFKKDVELVWQNCRTFNAPDTMVVQFANLLERLSRSMCIAAEKKGVDRLIGKESGGDGGDESEYSLSDASKTGSRSSVNKAWTESSASESRNSSDDGASPHGHNGDMRSHKRRSTHVPAKNLRTRARSTRPSGNSSRSRRNTRSRSSRKRQSPTSSSEKSSASDDDTFSSRRRSRRQRKRLPSKVGHKVDPPIEDEDPSDGDSANNQPPPPHNSASSPSPSPPPPPPPQTAHKRSRLVISDSSNSDDSSDSDDSSSSSSSSDSVDSDSETLPANKYSHPSPPFSADAPTPPPPSPPPPAMLSENDKAVQSSLNHKAKLKSAAGEAKKAKPKAAEKDGCTHSPPLLNSYLSPSSSSSSDFSSDDSDSSDDGNSDST